MKTNTQIVNSYIKQSPINQVFLIEAINRYAKQITENREEVIKMMESGFISGECWVEAAESWIKHNK